jgi:hypothetical protein
MLDAGMAPFGAVGRFAPFQFVSVASSVVPLTPLICTGYGVPVDAT